LLFKDVKYQCLPLTPVTSHTNKNRCNAKWF